MKSLKTSHTFVSAFEIEGAFDCKVGEDGVQPRHEVYVVQTGIRSLFKNVFAANLHKIVTKKLIHPPGEPL